jgi:type I restriction enzyme S subunit
MTFRESGGSEDMWEEMPLGDVITLQRGFDLPKKQRRPGAVPVVSSSGSSGNHNEARVAGPGVVTGRYGTIGSIFFVDEPFWPLNTTLWVKDFKGNDPRFVYYLLQTLNWQAYNDKTSVPGVNRNHVHLATVVRPPLSRQRQIAAVLGAFDAKIAANQRMEARLRTLLLLIFRRHVVRGEEGEQVPLSSVADFINGRNFTKDASGTGRPVIRIRELAGGVNEGTVFSDLEEVKDEHVARFYDPLFAWSGTLGVHRWEGAEGLVNQHIFKVLPRDGIPAWFVECWLEEHMEKFAAIARDKATTMGHIQRKDLDGAMVIVPRRDRFAQLDACLGRIDVLRLVTARERYRLAAIRNRLLPRLIDGRLEVSAAYEPPQSDTAREAAAA